MEDYKTSDTSQMLFGAFVELLESNREITPALRGCIALAIRHLEFHAEADRNSQKAWAEKWAAKSSK